MIYVFANESFFNLLSFSVLGVTVVGLVGSDRESGKGFGPEQTHEFCP